jgi:hypothetical protein
VVQVSCTESKVQFIHIKQCIMWILNLPLNVNRGLCNVQYEINSSFLRIRSSTVEFFLRILSQDSSERVTTHEPSNPMSALSESASGAETRQIPRCTDVVMRFADTRELPIYVMIDDVYVWKYPTKAGLDDWISSHVRTSSNRTMRCANHGTKVKWTSQKPKISHFRISRR